MSEAMKEWQEAAQAASPITTDLLDKLGKDYKDAWDALEKAELANKPLKEKAEQAEAKLNEALIQAAKEKYHVEGVGTFSFVTRVTVQTPKTRADKQAIAKYLETKGGRELFWDLFGINSNTLQSWYKAEKEEFDANAIAAQERGEPVENFHIPGVGNPVAAKKLRLTPERK